MFKIIYLFYGSFFHAVLATPKYPFQDPTLTWEARVDDLVERLTLDEIVSQTVTLYDGSSNTAVPRLDIKPYVWITECVRGQGHTNTTAFPHSLGLAATFRSVLKKEKII